MALDGPVTVGRNIADLAAKPSQYLRLDPDAVASTQQRLRERIQSRFPNRNLVLVAGAVGEAINAVPARGQRSSRQLLVQRARWLGVTIVTLLAVGALVLAFADAVRVSNRNASFEWVALIESTINDLVFAGIAIYFLVGMPARVDRKGILSALYSLRSLAHVVDMHQLTKDPERMRSHITPTSASTVDDMTPEQLGRYLDYCSELLAIISKTAALYTEVSGDPIVLETVSEIESLTQGLSRKIWQKLSLLHEH